MLSGDMDIKTILKKYLVFVIGLYFLAAGIVLIIHSALGTTPISSVNYVLSLNSPLSLGTCTFIVNVLLILGQFWLIRKQEGEIGVWKRNIRCRQSQDRFLLRGRLCLGCPQRMACA